LLFLISNVIFKTKLWAFIFIIGAPIFYFLYKKSIVNYVVLNTEGTTMDIWVLDDKNQNEIISEIFKQRDSYLKKHYLAINFENEINDEINKFIWLKTLKLINEKEFDVVKEEIIKNNSKY
jgi:hypothetical protein